MATTVKVQNLTELGAIAVGDKFVGERVAGQTRLITYTPRTMTGSSSITVVDGDQVSGNPTFSISATYAGQATITTVGTVATGTWQATAVGVAYGGTGLTSTTANQLLYSSSNNVIAGLTTANSGILATSAGGVPAIGTDIPTAVTIGGQYIYRAGGTDIPLADGGLNASLTASNGGIFYSTGSAGAILAGTATANKMLLSGASGAPTWSTPTMPSAAGSSGNVLTSDGTNWVSQAAPSGTEVTQAQQETATNTTAYVSAAKQQYHPSASKSWAIFGVTGNVLASYNVSSVTDTGPGVALVNFTVSFSSANYAVTGSLELAAATQVLDYRLQATGSCSIRSTVSAGTQSDPTSYSVHFFGDQ